MSVHAPRPWIPAAQSFGTQPEILSALPAHLEQLLAGLGAPPARVALMGIGASHAAAAVGAHRMRWQGLDATRHLPGEVSAMEAATVVAVSQSGRSAEVVDIATRLDPEKLISLTNYAPSPLGQIAHRDINLGDHPDSSVSFVSVTATMVALGMLADRWAARLDVPRWSRTITDALAAASATEIMMESAAEVLAAAAFVDVVAPARVMGVAEEGALILREGPRIAALGMETRHYLHGPMDAAGDGAHLVIGGQREALLVDQLAERTKNLVFIAIDEARPSSRCVSVPLAAAGPDPVGQAIATSILIQRLALSLSAIRGVDIDEVAFTRLDTKVTAP